MQSQHIYRIDETRKHQLPSVEPVLQTLASGGECEQGHAWQPTIIIGYFQCGRCQTLAACHLCVAKIRGKPLVGVCRQHQHLRSATPHQEVLA